MSSIKKSVYILYYEWPNTAGNHAGMAYFFRCFKKKGGMSVKLVRVPKNYASWPYKLRRLWQIFLVKYIKYSIKAKDIIFLTEYLGGKRPGDHREIALELKKKVSNHMIGLIHLPFKTLNDLYDRDYIQKSLEHVDNILTFGSSLTKDLSDLGFGSKLYQTFHYVDIEFYKPGNSGSLNEEFKVIVMGFLYRNRSKLLEIIRQCHMVTFDLCLGNNEELHKTFSNFNNVRLNKFLPENELLMRMQEADASLSVFDETVGSNVITTSLACGLPQVVSDVGSIRDYCSADNAIFCKSVDEFIIAIQFLFNNREKCFQMGINARKRAEELSLEKSIDWYRNFFSTIE